MPDSTPCMGMHINGSYAQSIDVTCDDNSCVNLQIDGPKIMSNNIIENITVIANGQNGFKNGIINAGYAVNVTLQCNKQNSCYNAYINAQNVNATDVSCANVASCYGMGEWVLL